MHCTYSRGVRSTRCVRYELIAIMLMFPKYVTEVGINIYITVTVVLQNTYTYGRLLLCHLAGFCTG
jgi:hypothetical protein